MSPAIRAEPAKVVVSGAITVQERPGVLRYQYLAFLVSPDGKANKANHKDKKYHLHSSSLLPLASVGRLCYLLSNVVSEIASFEARWFITPYQTSRGSGHSRLDSF
jgi:hypothetical protein